MMYLLEHILTKKDSFTNVILGQCWPHPGDKTSDRKTGIEFARSTGNWTIAKFWNSQRSNLMDSVNILQQWHYPGRPNYLPFFRLESFSNLFNQVVLGIIVFNKVWLTNSSGNKPLLAGENNYISPAKVEKYCFQSPSSVCPPERKVSKNICDVKK